MDKEKYWEMFKKTGKIKYYLAYKKRKQLIILVEKVEGIVLSETPYKETSKILNIFT